MVTHLVWFQDLLCLFTSFLWQLWEQSFLEDSVMMTHFSSQFKNLRRPVCSIVSLQVFSYSIIREYSSWKIKLYSLILWKTVHWYILIRYFLRQCFIAWICYILAYGRLARTIFGLNLENGIKMNSIILGDLWSKIKFASSKYLKEPFLWLE